MKDLLSEKETLLAQKDNLEHDRSIIARAIIKYEVYYNTKVNSLVTRILHLKTQLAAKEVEQHPNNGEVQEKYIQAKNEEDKYDTSYEKLLDDPISDLTEEQELDLKKKFRKIVFMVHDDQVHEHFSKSALEVFLKAKVAKKSNDINTINSLFEYLETEKPFSAKSDMLTVEELQKKEIIHLQHQVQELIQDIIILKNSEPYATIAEIGDWDTYFENTANKLKTEIEYLEKLLGNG